MKRTLLRPITDAEIDAFWRDGVVCLRGVVDQGWLDYLVEPVEQLIASPDGVDLSATVRTLRERLEAGELASDPMFGALTSDAFLEDDVESAAPGNAKFIALTHVYPSSEPMLRFETESMLPEIAAILMRTDKVHLFIDQIFVKEPGTPTRTAFHVDESYFNLTGEQVCTMWVPLDPATRESSTMGYIPGSHLWDTRYKPNNFISQEPSVIHETAVNDSTRARLPDIEANPDDFGIVYIDVEPGDVIVHHYRTVHGSGGNTTMSRRRRALSIRYTGDDVRWGPGETAGERLPPGLSEGDSIDRAEAVFPTCFER